MANESTTASFAGIRPTKGNPQVIDQVHDTAIGMQTVHWQDALGFAAVIQGRVSSTTSATAVSNGATEADAQTVSEITTVAATYTPAIKAVFVIASMAAMLTTPVDLEALASRTIGIALANKLDTDIFALFSGFASVVGTSGLDLSLDDCITAGMTLRVNAGNRFQNAIWMFHPTQVADLNRAGLNSNSPFVISTLDGFFPQAGKAMAGNYLGVFQGFQAFNSSLVGTVNAGADRGGALYVVPSAGNVGSAIGGALIALSQGGGGSMLPQQRLANAMAGYSMYAVGEEMDVFGVLVQSDA